MPRLFSAPSSTKKRKGQRDLEMRQTKKGNQWCFGMKAHIGVDSKPKLIQPIAATPAHVRDSQVSPHLLHGDGAWVWGDSAYTGQGEVIREQSPNAKDFTHKKSQRSRPLRGADHASNRSPGCERRSNIRFWCLSISSVLPRYATADWTRAPNGRLSSVV